VPATALVLPKSLVSQQQLRDWVPATAPVLRALEDCLAEQPQIGGWTLARAQVLGVPQGWTARPLSRGCTLARAPDLAVKLQPRRLVLARAPFLQMPQDCLAALQQSRDWTLAMARVLAMPLHCLAQPRPRGWTLARARVLVAQPQSKRSALARVPILRALQDCLASQPQSKSWALATARILGPLQDYLAACPQPKG